MPTILPLMRLGNPILRTPARRLSTAEILSGDIQEFIADLRHTVGQEKAGVGIAAPQVGKGLAICVIAIKPTPNRPDTEPFEAVMVNPEISPTAAPVFQMWEGCMSVGTGDDVLYAKVPRHELVTVTWQDERAAHHTDTFAALRAQVAQHEVDHLNGIVYLHRVTDPRSYMMADEYRKRVVNGPKA